MTSFWFAGGENPSHHDIFTEHEIDRVAVNIGSLKRNYWGSFSGLGIGTPNLEWVAWTDDDSSLDDLLEVIARIGPLPEVVIGPPSWHSHTTYLPIWDGSGQLPVTYMTNGVAVTDSAFKDKAARKRALSAKTTSSMLAVITGRSRDVEKFDLVINTCWYNVQSIGETQIFDGSVVRRYPAPKKEESRTHHRTDIEDLSCDFNLVLADDPQEVMALTMRSWSAFSDRLANPPSLPMPVPVVTPPLPGQIMSGVAKPLSPATAMPRTRHVIPTMKAIVETVEDDDGFTTEETLMVGSTSSPIRKCDNCVLAQACPAYDPGHLCGYEIPVELRTMDQMTRLMQVVLEIQTQRIMQARFSEEIQGQELSEATGKEMERLFKLFESMQKVTNPQEGFKLVMSATGMPGSGTAAAGEGVLSKLFGKSIGEAAREPLPVMTLDADDAEVIEG